MVGSSVGDAAFPTLATQGGLGRNGSLRGHPSHTGVRAISALMRVEWLFTPTGRAPSLELQVMRSFEGCPGGWLRRIPISATLVSCRSRTTVVRHRRAAVGAGRKRDAAGWGSHCVAVGRWAGVPHQLEPENVSRDHRRKGHACSDYPRRPDSRGLCPTWKEVLTPALPHTVNKGHPVAEAAAPRPSICILLSFWACDEGVVPSLLCGRVWSGDCALGPRLSPSSSWVQTRTGLGCEPPDRKLLGVVPAPLRAARQAGFKV